MRVPEIIFHTYVDDLGENPVVVDAGGNLGDFSKFILENYKPKIYMLEPVPELFNSIPKTPGVAAFNEALVAKDGPVVLDVSPGYGSTHPGFSPAKPLTVQGVGITTFLDRIKEPEIDLFKMDIEGSEIEILEQIPPAALRRIRQLTVEFHDFIFHELTPRVEAIKKRIEQSGFYRINFSLNNGDVLFIRKDRISWPAYAWLNYVLKYWRGGKRLFRRHVLRENI